MIHADVRRICLPPVRRAHRAGCNPLPLLRRRSRLERGLGGVARRAPAPAGRNAQNVQPGPKNPVHRSASRTGRANGGQHGEQPDEELSRAAATRCPVDDRFCGKCGSKSGAAGGARPRRAAPARPCTSPASQPPGRAKLIVVKGDTGDGVSYQLNGTEHVVGRTRGGHPVRRGHPHLAPARQLPLPGRQAVRARRGLAQRRVHRASERPSTWNRAALFLVGEQLLQVEAVGARLRPPARRRGHLLLRQPQAGLEDAAHPAIAGRATSASSSGPGATPSPSGARATT